MRASRADTRRRRATTAWAAALLVVLGGVVTASGVERPERPGVRLAFRDTPRTHYLRALDAPGKEPPWGQQPEAFYVALEANRTSPGRVPTQAEKIKVTFDLSDAKAVAVSLDPGDRLDGCMWSGALVTCTPKDSTTGKVKDIASGEYAYAAHLHLLPKKQVPKGPVGSLKITVTSSNAPTIHHTTQLVNGAPHLTTRGGAGGSLPDPIEPGSELKLRPAFGNDGEIGIESDLSIVVDVKGQATLRRQYRNCRYDQADAPKKAVCTIPGPLSVGAAYETDRPFTAVVDKTGSHGLITSTLYPAPNTPSGDLLPASAPRGTGAPIGFRPTDSSRFQPFDKDELSFLTTRRYDQQVNGFTLKGKVGDEISMDVMDVDGYFDGDTYLTLPEGLTLIGHRDGESGDDPFCEYYGKKRRTVLCPTPLNVHPTLRFRIDKRVKGARGTVFVKPDPEHPDPDLTNNTAPITMEYLD
ncbi:hypothetical protein [Streptomyces sp. NPDC093097]|uniref:hypothetical protein n=1 Tax=Streptomyces sp. NPDC093097 TaxID=3366027 RepID=UPI003827055F